MLILGSFEFIDLYRGDKDLRLGIELVRRYSHEYVLLVPSSASPSDRAVGVGSRRLNLTPYEGLPAGMRISIVPALSMSFVQGAENISLSVRLSPGQIAAILRECPDVILESAWTTLTPRMYQTALAGSLHDIPVIYIDAGDIPSKGRVRRALSRIETCIVNRSAGVIAYNEAARLRYIREYQYPAERVHVIPKPVDAAAFRPDLDGSRLRSLWGAEGKYLVGFFGRLSAAKGYQHLIQAAGLLRDSPKAHDLTYVFVGPGNPRHFQECTRDLAPDVPSEQLKSVGMQPHTEMPEAYAACDAVVIPDSTTPPAFTTVLAESMAAGRAIIIGCKGWESATPIEDGVTGLVVPPRDASAISKAIAYLRDNPSEGRRMGKAAREFAASRMDWPVVAAEYHRIVSNVAAAGSA